MLFGVVLPVGVKVRLFVRLIVRLVPAALNGTVITTGDQVAVATDAGFNAAHVAVEPVTATPQK